MAQAAPAPHQVTVEVGGRTLTLETGKVAKQANGAVLARYGDTVVLVTACMDSKPNDRDFLPLTVDYREYTYSAGKIPGGFFKREGRPSEREILTSRLIDRPLRPLFPESWRNETQIVAMVLSADSENDPDMIGITGASAAAFISDLPFTTPVAAVRIGLVEGKLLSNPTVAQQKTSLLNIVVVASEQAIVMIEAGAIEVSEDAVADALQFGHDEVKRIIGAIRELHDKVKPNKVVVPPLPFDESLAKDIELKFGAKLHDAIDTAKYPKKESYLRIAEVKNEVIRPRFPRTMTESGRWRPGRSSGCVNATSVRTSSSATGVRMRAHSTKSGTLPARLESCRARTAPRFSRAARRKRWRRRRSARRKISSASICCSRTKRSNGSCCITTFRRSQSAK